MLVVSGIILTCLSGLLLTGIIGTRFSWTERIGLSFPLGMTLQTVVMALLDLMHIPLTSFSVLSAGAVTFALLMFIVARTEDSKVSVSPRLCSMTGNKPTWYGYCSSYSSVIANT